jgi:mono/diheme cytochrome c family protein
MKNSFFLFFLMFCLFCGAIVSKLNAALLQKTKANPFWEEKCQICHPKGLENANEENNWAKDWQYALLWDPKLLLNQSKMPSYANQFKVLQVSISKRQFQTLSGNIVYGLSPDVALKKIFTFNPNHLIYLYLSATTWNHPPVQISGIEYGLKAFCQEAAWPNEKANGYPVVWIPPELKGAIHPGYKLFLIVPKTTLRALVVYNQTFYPKRESAWLSVPISDAPESQNSNEGKNLFKAYCLPCHGEFGNGNGPLSVFLFPKPRDFTSGEFKFKSTPSNELPSDADLFRTISNGLNGTAMPSFQFLSPQERWDLVAYIKTFAVDPSSKMNLFVEHPPKKEIAIEEPKWYGKTLDNAIKQGKKLFFSVAKCNDCHGPGPYSKDNLPHGDGPSALSQIDDWGYPIKPANLAGGILKRGNDPADIYLDITIGLTGTAMPAYEDVLSTKERWEIAFYVSQLNHKYQKNSVHLQAQLR